MVGTKFDKHTSSLPNDMHACLLNSKRDPFLRDFAGSQETLVFSVCARWLETRSFLPPRPPAVQAAAAGAALCCGKRLSPQTWCLESGCLRLFDRVWGDVTKNARFTGNYFSSSDPHPDNLFVIVSDISFWKYIRYNLLTFYFGNLSGILFDILFWHSTWHSI